jgi:uncharacterized protein (DUF983 family)
MLTLSIKLLREYRFNLFRGERKTNVIQKSSYSPPSPYVAGLLCRCPRCGKGKLFTGFLKLRPCCEVCGLNFAFAESGDGPAVFVILIAGLIVVGAALGVELKYEPPYWVHAILWGPLILIVTLGPLRLIKGLLIALQYHHGASEGRRETVDE